MEQSDQTNVIDANMDKYKGILIKDMDLLADTEELFET